MCKSLREVAEEPPPDGVVFLSHQADVVAQTEQALEQAFGLLLPTLQKLVVRQPERARQECALASRQAVRVRWRQVPADRSVGQQ